MTQKGDDRFETTRWSLIVALPGNESNPTPGRAREALEHLCNAYWGPLYAFARFRGSSVEDAHDLTQAFLANVIESGGLQGADPNRGRFRSYILGAMKHFMANVKSREQAHKRGGQARFLRADVSELESRIANQSVGGTPADIDRAFDRGWAHETTALALRQLRAEWSDRGRADQFEILRKTLGTECPPRSELAAQLGMNENAVAVATHRLRQRYRALVREAVARTVLDEADIDDELQYLIEVLREN